MVVKNILRQIFGLQNGILPMLNSKAIVLITVLVFLILVMLITVAVIAAMTSQARLTEHQVRRIQAFYTAEAGIYRAFEDLMNGTFTGPWSVTENYLTANVTYNTTSNTLTASVDYYR